MNTIKQKLLTNWTLMRFLRLALGAWILVMAIQTSDMSVGLFSAFFILTALTNTGCCAGQSCSIPDRKPGKEIE